MLVVNGARMQVRHVRRERILVQQSLAYSIRGLAYSVWSRQLTASKQGHLGVRHVSRANLSESMVMLYSLAQQLRTVEIASAVNITIAEDALVVNSAAGSVGSSASPPGKTASGNSSTAKSAAVPPASKA